MIYTLFFSRLREMGRDELAEYRRLSGDLMTHAREHHPGFVDLKTYTAEDGERLSVVRFTDEDAQRAWRVDHHHREAQRVGRADFYEHFRIVVCEPVREQAWQRRRDRTTGGTPEASA